METVDKLYIKSLIPPVILQVTQHSTNQKH
jgi:hypothetical protein